MAAPATTTTGAAGTSRARPLAVAFTGQDGTGKSTQLARLSARLIDAGARVQVVHQYGPTTMLGRGALPWAKSLANRVMRGGAREARDGGDPRPASSMGGPEGARAPGPAGRWLRWWLASASLLAGWRRSRRNWRRHAACDVLVLDRFFSDEIIRAAHKFGRAPAWSYRFLEHRTPRPDVVFTFRLDPRTGWERKKTRELSLAEYEHKTRVVRQTLQQIDRLWPIVSIDVDELDADAVFDRVWSEVRGRL